MTTATSAARFAPASLRSKGTMGDSTKSERRALTRGVRRAGRVSLADALTEREEERDSIDDMYDAWDVAELDGRLVY